MTLLQSFDDYNQFLNLDTEVVLSIDSDCDSIGWYKIIDGKVSAIYVKEGNLFLRFGGENISLDDNKHSRTETMDASSKIFELIDENQNVILRFRYIADTEMSGVAPFDYIDQEDFDWGLFLLNIINNKERKINFIEVNSQ